MPPEKVKSYHQPVLLQESLRWLNPQENEIYVDATLGLGGHTEAILQAAENVQVIAIDQDAEALALAQKRLAQFQQRVKLYHSNFTLIKQVLAMAGIEKVNGILVDLGVSSWQLDNAERGFSFRFDAPLDMRMNKDSEMETAAELLERLSEPEIAELLYKYGEERFSRRIARRIVWKREIGEPIRTTFELAETVEKALSRKNKSKIHPATRTFQALRIAVNHELENLEGFLLDSIDVLKPKGKLAVITFHSLEDRIVKQTFQKFTGKCFCPPHLPQCQCGAEKKVEILTRKPVVPNKSEIAENPRARSAKFRVCQKI
jgi:16S rRNA (cytosine1402-N4)-methyltransferase